MSIVPGVDKADSSPLALLLSESHCRWPDLHKIGITRRTVEERVAEEKTNLSANFQSTDVGFLGTTPRIEPSVKAEGSALGVEEQRVNAIADFADPLHSLGDGYRVEAQIVTWAGEDVLKVSLIALFRCEDQTLCIFVAKDDQAQQRRITISHCSNLEAAVEQGLAVGDLAILHPTEQIKVCKRVRDRL